MNNKLKFGPLDPRSAWVNMASNNVGDSQQMLLEQAIPALQATTSPLATPPPDNPKAQAEFAAGVESVFKASSAPAKTTPDGNRSVSVTKSFYTPEDDALRKQLMQQFSDKMKASEDQQLAGIADMEKAAEQYSGQRVGYDIRPLAGLVDSLTGSNLYKSVSDSMGDTPEEKRQKLMAMKDKIQGMKGAMSKDQLAYMKEQINALNDKLKMQITENMADKRLSEMEERNKRFFASMGLKMEDTVRKDVNKLADEFIDDNNNLNLLENKINSGDARSIGMAVAAIARNVQEQKGALSDKDIALSFPADLATNWSQLSNYLGGQEKISPQLQAALKKLVVEARANAKTRYAAQLQNRKEQYSAGSYSGLMKEGKVGDVIFKKGEQALGPSPSVTPAPSSVPAPGGSPGAFRMPTPEEIAAEAARRAALRSGG